MRRGERDGESEQERRKQSVQRGDQGNGEVGMRRTEGRGGGWIIERKVGRKGGTTTRRTTTRRKSVGKKKKPEQWKLPRSLKQAEQQQQQRSGGGKNNNKMNERKSHMRETKQMCKHTERRGERTGRKESNKAKRGERCENKTT